MSVLLKASKEFWKDLDRIKDIYNCPKIFFYIDECFSFLINGSSPHDYMNFQFYKLKQKERKRFITFKKKFKIDDKYNPLSDRDYFNNKALFNKTFKNFIKRDWMFCGDKKEEDVKQFISSHGKIIAKPYNLSCGEGIFLINKNTYDAKYLINNKYMLEEFIVQNSQMSQLNSSSVNTIRVYAALTKQNNVEIVYSALRIGAKGKIIDNYNGGGIGYVIDNKTGVVCKAGKYKGSDVSDGNIYIPCTDFQIIGFKIPMWNDLINFVKEAAHVIPTSRFIAWDVAITEKGFELVEGNHHGDNDFLQSIDQIPKYQIIKKILS